MILCFLDTETTGTGPNRLAYEVAMIRREEDGAETEVSFFVDVDLAGADPKALEVGRFYERHPYGRYLSGRVKEAPTADPVVTLPFVRPGEPEFHRPAWAAEIVARLTYGAHIVGAVPSFDSEMLAALLRSHRLVPAWHHRLVCVESVTSGHLHRYVGGLRRCAEALGIEVPVDGEHTALGDARIARDIWDRVMQP